MTQTALGKKLTMNELIQAVNAPVDLTVLTDTYSVINSADHVALSPAGAYYECTAIDDDVYIKSGADGVAPTTSVGGYGAVIPAGTTRRLYLIGPYIGYITTSTAKFTMKYCNPSLY